VPPRLPAGVVVLVGVLLLIPMVALAIVPVYARSTPRLWGFPFFYWYQFAWVLVTAVLTYLAYLVVTRARRTGGSR
jgi:membrane protein implicated in regulation of membrane protease activity